MSTKKVKSFSHSLFVKHIHFVGNSLISDKEFQDKLLEQKSTYNVTYKGQNIITYNYKIITFQSILSNSIFSISPQFSIFFNFSIYISCQLDLSLLGIGPMN